MKRAVFAIALFSSLTAVGTAAYAQFGGHRSPADEAIEFRQSLYSVVGWYAHQLGDMAKGDTPYDKDAAVKAANVIATLSKAAPDAFPAGSDQGDTKAKSEIWSDPTGFKKDMDAFQQAAAKLAENAGDANAFKSSFGDLGKACKNCHDDYRKKRL